MEHANPILLGNNSPQKFITIGEVMLRLTPPNYEKIRMASSFEASYGGSEANIALALANLGVDSTFFSVVPNNSLGKSAIRWLRCNDVHCTPMILSTKEETPSCRLGTYYLETGYGIRPSKVIYDRMHSALTEYDLTKVDLQELFEGFDWLHLSGITPALNKNCADFILRCLREAKEMGLTVSFDGNFRSSLWTWEEARDYCTQCLPYVDVLFGIEPYHLWKDEENHAKGDWKDGAISRQLGTAGGCDLVVAAVAAVERLIVDGQTAVLLQAAQNGIQRGFGYVQYGAHILGDAVAVGARFLPPDDGQHDGIQQRRPGIE